MPKARNHKLRQILAANVRNFRMAKNWSQEKLGAKAGYSQRYISFLESSKSAASVDAIEDLAKALGTTPSELLS